MSDRAFDPHASPVDFSDSRTNHKATPIDRLPPATVAVTVMTPDTLDSRPMVELQKRLMSYYIRELRRQEDNRREQELDEEFFDNVQWDEADAAVLRERGQVPIVYNVIAPTLNWIIGTEKRSRTDFKILPRRKDAGRAAERKTQLMKYLSDVNRSQFARSRAFEDAAKTGVGWIETGVQNDDDGEPVYDRYESWRNMLWDSASTEKDLSDCRYVCRAKWVDLDVAISMFPDRRRVLEKAALDADRFISDDAHGDAAMDSLEDVEHASRTELDDTNYARPRVRLIEIWFRQPIKVDRLSGGQFAGEVADHEHAGHNEAIASGDSVVVSRNMMRMHVAIMTTADLLFIGQTPYRHNDFPFTPIWCYRRGKNGMPYGFIRGLRDIQSDVNKRASKALHILSTSKTIMDEGAVADIEEFTEEVSRPDAVIVKKAGKELRIEADRDLAPAHLEMMSRDIAMIQSVSGVTDENMGRNTNARSGIAIQARQSQGALATAGAFDNLRFACQVHGSKVLSLTEQYFTETKSFRITNMRGSPEYVTVNDGLPENDITRSKADFIISEDDWRMSIRQAQTAELLELLQQLAPVAPQIAIIMLDLLVESMDIPNRDELVRRIRQQTGMRDPDAEEPTPEEIQRAQAQAEQAALQKALLEAQVQEAQAKVQLTAMQAAKAKADGEKILAALAGVNVQSQRAALEVALAALASPATVPVADGILHEAGFVSRSDQEDDAFLADAIARRDADHAERAQNLMAHQQAETEKAAMVAQMRQPQPQVQPQPGV